MRARELTAVSLMIIGLLAGCTAPRDNGGTSGDDVASLIRDRCTRCHSIDRIKSAEHDRSAWEDTVARMRGRGAEVNDEEAGRVIEFLAGGGGKEL